LIIFFLASAAVLAVSSGGGYLDRYPAGQIRSIASSQKKGRRPLSARSRLIAETVWSWARSARAWPIVLAQGQPPSGLRRGRVGSLERSLGWPRRRGYLALAQVQPKLTRGLDRPAPQHLTLACSRAGSLNSGSFPDPIDTAYKSTSSKSFPDRISSIKKKDQANEPRSPYTRRSLWLSTGVASLARGSAHASAETVWPPAPGSAQGTWPVCFS
jgi:hypothetical protein